MTNQTIKQAVEKLKAAKWKLTADPNRVVFYQDTFEQLEAFGSAWTKFMRKVIADRNKDRPAVRGVTYTDQFLDAISLKEFEADSVIDYLLIPYYLIRWLLAYAVTVVWAYWRIIRRRPKDRMELVFCTMWGRSDSPEPAICPRCLWAGMQRWLYHGYCSDGAGDVEACDECPRCGNNV